MSRYLVCWDGFEEGYQVIVMVLPDRAVLHRVDKGTTEDIALSVAAACIRHGNWKPLHCNESLRATDAKKDLDKILGRMQNNVRNSEVWFT